MKTTKRLTALFLTLCLMLSVFVPASYIKGNAAGTTLPVAPENAYKDIIYTVQCEIAVTGTCNGQDYLYLFFKDGLMLVYDLDTDTLVDTETDVFTTPVDAYVDGNGVVWACGAARKLYKYDPKTGTGTLIDIPSSLFPVDASFSVYGITGDGQGNLYFGTYDCAYLGKFDTTNTFTRVSGELDADAAYAGKGGVYIRDGFAYLTVNGNKNGDNQYTHKIIKYNLSTNQVVQSLDYSHLMGLSKKMPDYTTLVGDYLICSTDENSVGTAIVDISGENMALVTINGLSGIKGAVSPEINGKVYFMSQGNAGLMAMDVETYEVTATQIANNDILACEHGGAITVGNDPALLTFTSPKGADTVNLKIYNLATGAVVEKINYTDGTGSANQLRSIALSEDGKVVYVGAYQTGKVVGYDVTTGEKVQEFYTGGQNDSLLWYNGYLYAGMYSQCSIGQYTPSTGAGQVLSRINNGAFYQNRAHAIAAGDGKVFVGTVPGAGHLGGTLMWYDSAQSRIYVSAGPDSTNVFYAEAGHTSARGWYYADGTSANDFLDTNGDGTINTEDYFVTGVIQNQSINNLIYKDGYLIGSTTIYGGSGSTPASGNACLFVYDVDGKQVVATYDATSFISGLTTPVKFIDALAEDPDVDGKFWGVVSDTLFSFNVDPDTKAITGIVEELSMGKDKYTAHITNWDSRDILFDGDYMYVSFGQNGTYMIEREDVQNYVKLSDAKTNQMVQAADGNIYYIDNSSDLKVLNVASAIQQIKDVHGIPKATALIAALPDAEDVLLKDEAAVVKAREAYEELSAAAKAQVDITRLQAAEAEIAQLNNGNVRLKYEFGNVVTGNQIVGYPGTEVDFTYSGTDLRGSDIDRGISKSSYLGKNQAYYAESYYNGTGAASRYLNLRLGKKDAWGAIKIYDVEAGTYDMTFDLATAGDTWVYVYTEAEWNAAISGYLAELQALSGTSATLAASGFIGTQSAHNTGTLASTSGAQTTATLQDVELAEDGNYVLVFRRRGDSGNAYKFYGLTMNGKLAAEPEIENPAVTVGGQKYATAAEALSAIESAPAGTSVIIHQNLTLQEDLTTDADMIVSMNVTVDLKGNDLTAGTIDIAGGLIDTSAQPGLLTANIGVCAGNNNGYLPLNDGISGGKRLYQINTQSLGFDGRTEDTCEFGFHTDFTLDGAYDYIGNMGIAVQMSWKKNGVSDSATATAEEIFVERWAQNVREEQEVDIAVTVEGMTGLTDFELIPVVTANNVTVALNPIVLP